MKNKNNDYIKWGVTAFLVVLGSFISYYIIFHLDSLRSTIGKIIVILMPVIDGLVLAYLLTPLVNATEKYLIAPFVKKFNIKGKKSRWRLISVFLTLIVVSWSIYGFFSIVIPQIFNSLKTIIEQFPNYVDTLNLWISKLLEDNPEIENKVMAVINEYSLDFETFVNSEVIPKLNSLIMTISLSVYSVFKEIWNLIIGFIISIYLLSSKELFSAQAKKAAYAFLSVDRANRFISNVRFANKTFGGFFVGKILDSIIIGILCFVGMSILDIPFSVLISVIIGVTNIIPFFGPFLGAIPSTLLILFIDPVKALTFIIFVFFLQQVDGNIIGPKILGSSTGLSSFWVIFAITLFGGIWGVFGMIVGVPIFAVLFAFMKSLVETHLSSKQLPPETNRYLKLLYINTDSGEFVEFLEHDKKSFPQITKILVKGHEKIKHQEKEKNKESKENNNINNNTEDDLK